jgi:hypothetical protein
MTCKNQNLGNVFLKKNLHVHFEVKYLRKFIMNIKNKLSIVCIINVKDGVKSMISFNKA